MISIKMAAQPSIDIAIEFVKILTSDFDEIIHEANCPLLTEAQKTSLHGEFRKRAETALGIETKSNSLEEATETPCDSSNADNTNI